MENYHTYKKNQLAIGVRNFYLMGEPCLMEFYHNGKNYKRLHTDVVPKRLAGHICSVQVYEEVNNVSCETATKNNL